MAELYRAVWRVTGRQQLVLIGLSVLVAAVAILPLKFQQLIVNSLVQAGDLPRLAWLCAGFFGAILISGALKFMLGLRLSIVGERVILLIRERLYTDHVAATSASADVPTRGTLVTMLASEAETVGAFAGGAIASPLVQLGTLISVISFIFASQPRLGVLALAVVFPQAAIVVALQNRISHRGAAPGGRWLGDGGLTRRPAGMQRRRSTGHANAHSNRGRRAARWRRHTLDGVRRCAAAMTGRRWRLTPR